jgi:RHS repeat-associated protein
MRLNDASPTTTGALTSGNARIMYTAAWSDGIDRQIASANYGAAASFTRPSTPPASSSTVLVNGRTYDLAGRIYQTSNPKSIVDQMGYDNASRTTQTIEDVAGLARTTNYTWTLDNNKATMTAVSPVTGDQTTAWLYGTTLAASGVARADLPSQTVYPDALGWSTLAVGQWANLGVDDWTALPLDPTGDVTSRTYNRLGEKLTFTDQRGVVRTFYRDKLGRQTNDCVTTCPAGVDSTVLQIATAYEIRGMVRGVTSFPNASTTSPGTPVNDCQLSYNNFAQLIQEYQSHAGAVVPGTTPSVQYAYDNGSANEIRLNALTYPNGRVISYNSASGMDALLNRVTSISDSSAILAAYTYLGLGTIVRITYPEPSVWLDLWGGTSGVFAGLDLFNRITDQRWQNNVTTTPADIDRYKYGYDFNSNRTWKQNAVGTPVVSGGLDEYYTMDNLDRLTDMQRGVLNSTFTGITGTPAVEQQWSLDLTGNWSQFATLAGGDATMTQGRVSNAVNEITSITSSAPPPPPTGTPTPTAWVTPVYDAAGNMTTMPQPGAPTSSFTATYDAWHQMMSVSAGGGYVGQYKYDGRYRRIVAVTASARHFYYTNSWQDVEQRVGAATTMDQQHVWGIRYIDELVCRDDATPERLYPTYDATFDATSVCDIGGAPQEHYYYDPYANRTVLDATWGPASVSAFGFSTAYKGLVLDAESGLVYGRSRFLHAVVGGWSQRDDHYRDSLNLYEALRSRPIVLADPYGTDSSDVYASIERAQRCIHPRCSVRSGPTYTPHGHVAPPRNLGNEDQPFDMSATFVNDPGNGLAPRCCEVRQYIQWDAAFAATQPHGVPHHGFPRGSPPNTWYEDRDEMDKERYGHRSGPHSDPGSNDEYLTAGSRDEANGATFSGHDDPGKFSIFGPPLRGVWKYKIEVVDVCNGERVVAGPDTITIAW